MGWQLFSLNKSLLKQTKFIQPLLILTLFCIVYWTTINDYGFLDKETSSLSIFTSIMRVLSFYIVGFSINYSRLPAYPYNTIIVLTFLVGSTIFYSVLSVLKTLQIRPSLIEKRQYLDYWTDIEWPATGVGNFLCLGLLYIVVVFYGYKYRKESQIFYIFFVLVSAIFVFFSFNITILLQNRLALMATAIGFVTIGFLWQFRSKLKFITLPLFVGLFALVSVGVNIIEVIVSTVLAQFGVFNERFLSQGNESGRFDNYQIALEKIWQYPFGGREFNLPVSKWVHNLWLDVAYDAGLIPMFLLLLYFILHINCLFKILNSDLPKIVIVYFTTLSIGILLNMSLGPIIQGSIFEFGMVCFFFGVIARLSGEVELSKKHQLSPKIYHANIDR
ncbi:MAG: O-antigen ligase domain-containing protein [Microcystis wesenbergii Mw_MB_S_20031200_S109]|uniref:O-antigen ligase domain-containing protein n=1 Tax=Microcystis wesenbergii Mw_MB_S_20031200_S109D TaxID=2486241 RepID=A0A552LKG4_9CHRO|nr:MAG: O-antigen ligase domain-containing protein [Microcystis wesenbergii Mw_MB_S_20031200_S109]TRV20705.1 MAG: O-antigen ligase domain-containing protein [Microcystis wesenbergii Mw_MB_S_20031200_S109D]